METIKSYFNKNGWKSDWRKTKEDFSSLSKLSRLENLARDEGGNIAAGLLLATLTAPASAAALSYIGEGVGFIIGNIIDYIPFVNNLAPWLAERSGLINDAKIAVDLNENLYQTTGAISGFWGGISLPYTILVGYFGE